MSSAQGADELRIRSILQQRGVGPDAHETATRPDEPTPAADPDRWWDDLYPEQPEPRPEHRPAPRLPPWWEAKKPVPAAPETPAEAETPPIPPKPAQAPRDWLDDILDSDPVPTPTEPEAEEPDEAEPAAAPTTATKNAPKPTRKQKRSKTKRPKPGAPRTAWDTRPASPRQSLLDAYDAVPYRLKWLAYHASAAYLGWSAGLVDYSTHVTAWIAATGLVGGQAFFWYGAATCTFLLYRRTRRRWWPVAWCAAIPATSTLVGVLLYGTPHP